MDNFNLDELMDLAEAYVGPMLDAIYRRLMDQDLALVVMLLTALINILGHDNRGERPTEVFLMAAYGERGVLDRPNMRVMRWRNGALSGSDLANEPGLGSSRTYQPGEMPLPTKPKPGLRRMHQEMNSEAASSSSQLRAAVPPKGVRVEEEVQTNETMQDLIGTKDELEKTGRELYEMTKTMLSIEEEWEVHHRDHENRTGCRMDRVAFIEEVCTVVQSYGTQSILKLGLNRPLMREVPDKLDEYEGKLNELLLDSATDESEANSPIKMTPQEDKREVVFLSRTPTGTMRSKLVIDNINEMKMKLGSIGT